MTVKRLYGWACRKLSRFRRKCSEWNIQASSLLINFALVASLVLCFCLIAMGVTQVRLATDVTTDSWLGRIAERLLGIVVGADTLRTLDPDHRAQLLGSLVSAVGAVVTALFAIVAWLVARAQSNARALRSLVTNVSVYSTSDDIDVMMQEYRGAKRIVVFGGDFSWIASNDDRREVGAMRELVARFASEGKISLISYRAAPTVSESVGAEFFEKLKGCIEYNSRLEGLQASVVTNNFGRVLIYKVHEERNEAHICRVTDRTRDGKELLDRFELLINTINSSACSGAATPTGVS